MRWLERNQSQEPTNYLNYESYVFDRIKFNPFCISILIQQKVKKKQQQTIGNLSAFEIKMSK